jgi:hypothetical protein
VYYDMSMALIRDYEARDVLLALLAFLAPPAGIYLYLIGREVGRAREEMRRMKADREAEAAEGFPPPGPPTTDSEHPDE